jgi:hypothetical protein
MVQGVFYSSKNHRAQCRAFFQILKIVMHGAWHFLKPRNCHARCRALNYSILYKTYEKIIIFIYLGTTAIFVEIVFILEY